MTSRTAIKKTTAVKKTPNIRRPRKLDIACGQRKKPGFKGIDISADSDADIVHDLFDFPWPIDTSSVSEAFCSHFAEHIPHTDRRWPDGIDGWFMFWDEVYRIMKKGGTVTVLHPYVMNVRAFWDPTHMRFIHEASWYYLDPVWREMQGLDHYPTKANFEVISVNGNGIPDDVMARSEEQQMFQRTHYWNVVADLEVVLKARK